MIEMESNKNRNLKNVKQIGTPREENKIYIENMTYNKIKEDSYREKRVFILMGRTERMDGKYSTFIEAVIPVSGMEFSGNLPRWNNVIWSEVFREIKRLYEDMIIVGWALDTKGMPPQMTPDLERVHREHFGGVHQLLFRLDTLEQDEVFYIYKENKLVSKDGFYIYHKARRRESVAPTQAKEETTQILLPEKSNGFRGERSQVEVDFEISEQETRRGGRYRQWMQEQKKPEKDGGNMGVAVAVAILIFVIGIGVYENSGGIIGEKDSIETNLLQGQTSTETGVENIKEDSTEKNGDEIEVEVISGNE